MLRQAMAQVGVSPENTIMIGDSTFDMLMARAAGVRAVGVSWGYHPVAALEEAGAQAIVHSYGELRDHLVRRGILPSSPGAVADPISP